MLVYDRALTGNEIESLYVNFKTHGQLTNWPSGISYLPSSLPTPVSMPAPTFTAQPSISRAPTAAPTAHQARKRDGRWRFLSLRPTTFAIFAALFALALLICCIWCSYAAHGQLAQDEAPKDVKEKAAALPRLSFSSAPPDDENPSAPPDDDARELGAYDAEEPSLDDENPSAPPDDDARELGAYDAEETPPDDENPSAPPDENARELGAYDAEEPSLTGTRPTARSLEVLGVHPNANVDLALIVPQVVEKKADGMYLCLSGADESVMAEVWRL